MKQFSLRLFAIMLVGMFIAGCEPVAHLAWSPDGSHAAYFVAMQGKPLPGSSFVIDPTGKITKPLGPAFGSFAWSTGSKSLYFAGYDDKKPTNNAASRKWLVNVPYRPATNALITNDFPAMALNRWHNGSVERLVSLGHCYVMVVQASPDQSWVAIVAFAKEFDGDPGRYELFAYCIASQKLYEISERCGPGVCFTSGNKLVYVEANWQNAHPQSTGQIVETTLKESVDQLPRTALMEVLWEKTTDLSPAPDGLLFTTQSRAFPAAADPQANNQPVSLYHYTRANGGISVVAESTGPLFLLSPDRKRILFVKITPATNAASEKRQLSLMNLNGSDAHVLCDLTAYGSHPPFLPTWHGNDRITFISPTPIPIAAKADQPARLAFDVVDYKITDSDSLQPAATLSQGWPIEMKPSMKASDYDPNR